MDMSTSRDSVPHIIEWLLSQFGDVAPQAQLNMMAMTIFLAFDINVHVGGPYIVGKKRGNSSGTAGTTTVNNHSSASMCATIEKQCQKVPDEEKSVKAFHKLLGRIVRVIRDTYGFSFKDVGFATDGGYIGECKFVVYKDFAEYAAKGDPLPFLGQVLVVRDDQHFFVPQDINGLVTSLVLPGSHSNPERNLLERILGVFISGGWADPQVNKFLRETFSAVRDAHEVTGELSAAEVPIGAEDVEDFVKFYGQANGIEELPSDEVMVDFHQLSKQEFFEKWKSARITRAGGGGGDAASSSSPGGNVGADVPEDDMELLRAGFMAYSSSAATVPKASAGKGNAQTSVDVANKKSAAEARAEKLSRARANALKFQGRAEQLVSRMRERGQHVSDEAYEKMVAEHESELAREEETEVVEMVKKAMKKAGRAYVDDLEAAENDEEVEEIRGKGRYAFFDDDREESKF
jgi:hypothetical protein